MSDVTGDVYVVDAAAERVEVFAPDGHGGYGFSSEFKVRTPGAITVDNSTNANDPTRGDVYVAGTLEKESTAEERDLVYEYSPSAGEVIHKWGAVFKTKLEGEQEELELEDISGLSVDAAGNLWVYWEEEGEIDELAKEATKGGAPKLVWRPTAHREPDIEFRFECAAHEGFAVAPDDSAFYTAYERKSVTELCPGEEEETPDPTVVAKLDATLPEPGTLIAEVDHQDTSGVAVDSSTGAVYLDNRGSIAAFSSEGVPIQRFGSGELSSASGIAVDSSTGDVFVAQPSSGEVDVFVPDETQGAPEVDGLSAHNLSPQSAQLTAQIDPKGAGTEYSFSYGPSECATSLSACTRIPAGKLSAGFGDREVSVEVTGLEPATAYFYRVVASNAHGSAEATPAVESFTTLPSPSVLPDGRAWELVTPVEKHGAAPVSVTRFTGGSIQASVDGGSLAWLASGPVVSEPEGNRSFEPAQQLSTRGAGAWGTVSLETAHEQGRGLQLPSPTEYHYFSPDLSTSLVQPTEPTRQVGGVFEHPALSAEATEKTMYVRHGSQPGSVFTPLVTAINDAADTKFGGALEFLGASTDLSHVVFESKVGLTAAAPSAAGLYEWSAGAPLKLVSVLPDGSPAPDESEAGSGFNVEPTLGDGGATNERNAISADGSRVFWSEERKFVPEALYLSDTETGESIKLNAAQGNGGTELGSGGTQLPEPAEEQQEVHFQSASGDGSKVFFTDTARLSEESGQEPTGEESPADLYEFELTSAPGAPPRGKLVDLSADPTAGSADVLNLIPGASDDGSSVYFVANGVLAAGASPGRCARAAESSEPPPPGSTCNLYVSEPDPEHPGARETRLIAKLASADAADWGAGVTGSGLAGNLSPSQDLAAVTSRVSPDGRYLAFMSERSLTGYDNRDAASGQPDEEVYTYDTATGRVVCASCNPNGESGNWKRPEGVFDTRLGGEGFGLLVDRPEIWQERWLASSLPGWNFNITNGNPSALYQPRYLSDSGRLFFDSSDALVPADTNGVEDVYQYEPDEVGSCASSGGCLGLISSGTSEEEAAFMDASESGDDVFFQTAAQLVAGDSDHAYDIYDARVCTESAPCLTSTGSSTSECESATACREVVAPPAQVAVPVTSTFAGPPSISSSHSVLASKTTKPAVKPLTRKQKLARALKACKKLKKKPKRAACERAAHKRYAPPKKHHTGAKSK